MNARAGVRQALAAVPVAAALLAFAAAAWCGEAAASGVWTESTSARAASEFWTVARMRAAKPLEVSSSTPRVRSGDRHGHRGKSRRLAARAGTFGSDFEAVADSTTPECRIHGAVFLSFGIFGYGRCSGTAVRSRNESVVITAGHCVN